MQTLCVFKSLQGQCWESQWFSEWGIKIIGYNTAHIPWMTRDRQNFRNLKSGSRNWEGLSETLHLGDPMSRQLHSTNLTSQLCALMSWNCFWALKFMHRLFCLSLNYIQWWLNCCKTRLRLLGSCTWAWGLMNVISLEINTLWPFFWEEF